MRSLRTCEWSAGTAARARPDRRSARRGRSRIHDALATTPRARVFGTPLTTTPLPRVSGHYGGIFARIRGSDRGNRIGIRRVTGCGNVRRIEFYSGIGFDFRDGLFRIRDSVRTPATSPDRPGDGVLPTRPLSAIDMRTRQLRTVPRTPAALDAVSARPSTSGGGGAPGAGARPARAARRAARTPAADGAAAGREASIRPYTATA